LHMAQLMLLPLTVSCFSKIQIGFTFLVPAHPGSPGQRAIKRVCVTDNKYTCSVTKKSSPSQLVQILTHDINQIISKNFTSNIKTITINSILISKTAQCRETYMLSHCSVYTSISHRNKCLFLQLSIWIQ